MLQSGQSFAHFTIIGKLGEGGMGQVYLAEDQKLYRRVALKVLTGDMLGDTERKERFYREAKTAAQISNPYVMSIYDMGQAAVEGSGELLDYIVMEYIEGASLGDYIRDERPDMGRVVTLAEKIASGLAAAHKLNIVHRDIKPDNILVDADRDPKILDFGLAKPLEPLQMEGPPDSTRSVSADLTKVGKIMGTVSYMSPEQIRGEAVDTRSDIFAFGILLYRMATGDMPFAGPTQVETMAKILESTYEQPRAKNELIPMELERIINKCLRKDPGERYQDTRDLVVDLRNLRKEYDSGISDTISSLSGVHARQSSSSKKWLLPLVAILAVVVVAVVYLTMDGGETTPASGGLMAQTNALAITGFENKTGDADLDWLETGLPEILLTDLSQTEGLQIISQQRVVDCMPTKQRGHPSHEECVKAAASLGATRILSGSFFKLGDKIRIDARLEDVNTGAIVIGEKVVGDDPFALVDSLTTKLAAALNIGETGSVSRLATSDPEAYKQYVLGMDFFTRSEFDSATAHFQQAIAIDSTFALPYMRIGMANVFMGKQTEGRNYFRMAMQYQDKLPVRDRSILDTYVDTWVNENFDDAFTKIQSLVKNYPEDAEIRTLYGLFIEVFRRDTTAAFAQFDTVLMTYPNYAFAVENYAALLERGGNLARAIEMTERLRQILPDSPEPLRDLADLYEKTDREREAEAIYNDLGRRFPDNIPVLEDLLGRAIQKREFEAARTYTERLKNVEPDDPFNLVDYWRRRANLANWEGKFKESLEFLRQGLVAARETGDTVQNFAGLSVLAREHWRFGNVDSALFYAAKANDWASNFQKSSLPMFTVILRPDRYQEVKPDFDAAMRELRARFPQNLWAMVDHLSALFEAYGASDTVAIVDAYAKLFEASPQMQDDDRRAYGTMLIKLKRYDEAIRTFENLVDKSRNDTSAWTYLSGVYWLGVAYDEKGEDQKAIEQFEELLSYWGDPDPLLPEIDDARSRLAALRS